MENYKKIFEENRSGSLSKEVNLINQYPELHKKIIDYALTNNLDIPFKQKIYHFINQIPKVPTCKNCTIGVVNFWTVNSGYKEFCSVKCSKNNSATNEKYKATLLEKYGTTDILNAKSTQDKIKTKRLEKYGVEHHTQSKEWIDEQKEKNIEKYGVESYFITNEFKEKSKKTCNEKYGTDYFSQTEEFKHNMEINNPMFNEETKKKRTKKYKK